MKLGVWDGRLRRPVAHVFEEMRRKVVQPTQLPTPYSHNWGCPGTGDRLILGIKRLHHRPAHFNAPVWDEGRGVWVGGGNLWPVRVNNISRCMG